MTLLLLGSSVLEPGYPGTRVPGTRLRSYASRLLLVLQKFRTETSATGTSAEFDCSTSSEAA
eukprot:2064052-Rhodomonas_salina.1